MYNFEDLFDKRSVVAARLEQVLAEKSYTKAGFCKETGISRPTLDKLLSGTITNMTNYEKHIKKALRCLSMTPDMLLGNSHQVYNRTRAIRKSMHIESEHIAEETGISENRLREIETGADATTAELRDIALCFSTNVRSIQGTNFFDMQVAVSDNNMQVCLGEASKDMTKYWGHVGLLPTATDRYLWFPITNGTRKRICDTMNEDRIVIPCMNNKLLYVNMSNIDNLVLHDKSCEPPDFANWDSYVSCGSIPLVVYEALNEYEFDSQQRLCSSNVISSNLLRVMQETAKKEKWKKETISDLLSTVVLRFKDGKEFRTSVDFSGDESITREISTVYDYGKSSADKRVLFYQDLKGTRILINMNNITFIELPLLKTEDAICKKADGLR